MDNATQQRIWESEHAKPQVLLQMDAEEPSSGVELVVSWLKDHQITLEGLRGVEMGCGKGRNGIYLADQGIRMESFDFASSAIVEAERRRAVRGVEKVHFSVQDATTVWPWAEASFDLGLDIFASTDIATPEGRAFARDEFYRVLKPGGYLFLYLLSTDDEFHAEMIKKYPVADQKNAFQHSENGKFEKVYERDELLAAYTKFVLVDERRFEKIATFHGQSYQCKHFWMVFRKPV